MIEKCILDISPLMRIGEKVSVYRHVQILTSRTAHSSFWRDSHSRSCDSESNDIWEDEFGRTRRTWRLGPGEHVAI